MLHGGVDEAGGDSHLAVFDKPISAIPKHESLDRADQLWTPAVSSDENDDLEMLEELVREQAGTRIGSAESILPGLGDAVVATLNEPSVREKIRDRASRQARALDYHRIDPIPEAWMAMDEAVERATQLIAATVRGTYIARGTPFQHGDIEDSLAVLLTDDSSLPIAIERTRHPRIAGNVIPSAGSPLWGSMHRRQETLYGTTSVITGSETPTVESGPFSGWFVAATAEQLRISGEKYGKLKAPNLNASSYAAVELGKAQLAVPPFGQGGINVLLQTTQTHFGPKKTGPLMMLESGYDGWNDGKETLGYTSPLVLPSPALVSMLALKPSGRRLLLGDQRGPGLALLTWRGRYVGNERGLGRPTLSGSAISIRPDLYARLLDTMAHLTYRSYLAGNLQWL